MDLIIKCLVAVILMIAVHFISKTDSFYISGLALGFPGLSMLAYYFMYMEQGAQKVQITTNFAMLSVIPFVIFLLVLNLTLKKNGILLSLLVYGEAWAILSSLLIIIWNKSNHL